MKTYPFDPDYVVAPGLTLDEWFETTNVPKSAAIKVWGIDGTVLESFLAGDCVLTDDLAKRLSHMTGIPPRFWVALEHNYRVGLAAGKSRM